MDNLTSPTARNVIDVMNKPWEPSRRSRRFPYEYEPSDKPADDIFCDIRENSQVVIYGTASCGKASLALKLALSPARRVLTAGSDDGKLRSDEDEDSARCS